MQVVRNVGYIKAQQRQGRRLTVLGLLGLSVAFVVVFQQGRPELIILAYAAMMFGFIFFNLGLQMVSKFGSNSRKPRNDQQLDRALERLNDRYTLVHYPAIDKRHPDHLLVHNTGVLVLTVRELPGQISVTGTKWRRGGSRLLRLFNYSGPQLGNPTRENEQTVALIASYLAGQGLPDETDGVIVFTHPAVTVRVTDSPVDVVDLDGLPPYIRALGRDRPQLTAQERQAIIDALSQGENLEQTTVSAARREARGAGRRAKGVGRGA